MDEVYRRIECFPSRDRRSRRHHLNGQVGLVLDLVDRTAFLGTAGGRSSSDREDRQGRLSWTARRAALLWTGWTARTAFLWTAGRAALLRTGWTARALSSDRQEDRSSWGRQEDTAGTPFLGPPGGPLFFGPGGRQGRPSWTLGGPPLLRTGRAALLGTDRRARLSSNREGRPSSDREGQIEKLQPVLLFVFILEHRTAVRAYRVAFFHEAVANFTGEHVLFFGLFTDFFRFSVLRTEHGDAARQVKPFQRKFGLNRMFKSLREVFWRVQDSSVVDMGDVDFKQIVGGLV